MTLYVSATGNSYTNILLNRLTSLKGGHLFSFSLFSFSFGFSRGLMAGLLLLAVASGCSAKKGGSDGLEGEEGYGRDGLSEADLAARQASRFNGNSIPTAEGEGPFRDIHFDYDSAVISAEAQMDIEANAQLLRQNPSLRLTLEGHCDERGTEDYNLSLGQARAKNVKDALVALGISGSRIETISYGENIPLETGNSEASWARNRRVHFSGAGLGALNSPRGSMRSPRDQMQDSGRGSDNIRRRRGSLGEPEGIDSWEDDASGRADSAAPARNRPVEDSWDSED